MSCINLDSSFLTLFYFDPTFSRSKLNTLYTLFKSLPHLITARFLSYILFSSVVICSGLIFIKSISWSILLLSFSYLSCNSSISYSSSFLNISWYARIGLSYPRDVHNSSTDLNGYLDINFLIQ